MSKSNAFSAVIFDFGGVFTTSPVSQFLVFEQENNLPDMFIGSVIKKDHHTNAWAKIERSEINIDQFDEMFAEETKAAGFEISGRTLVGLLKLQFYPAMIETLSRIKLAGFKTGCITNNVPEIDSNAMLEESAENQKTLASIFSNFDEIIESSKIGMRKPEPRIYELMCTKLNVTPTKCIFIDDLGINLKPAQAMGMTTIKAPLGDISPAIDQLNSYLGLMK